MAFFLQTKPKTQFERSLFKLFLMVFKMVFKLLFI